jgi:DNA-nicking Smr family endonuclease
MNKYLRPIDAQIDLHQMTKEEARREVEAFLMEAESLGYKKIRIITGKGVHSKNGKGVLGAYVKKLLDLKGYNYNIAKYGEGGEGAIDVSLY